MSNFTDDRHALYTGWVTGTLALNGVSCLPIVDELGDYTNSIEIRLPGVPTIALTVPPPAADWQMATSEERTTSMFDETPKDDPAPNQDLPEDQPVVDNSLPEDQPGVDNTLPGDLPTDEDIEAEEGDIEAPVIGAELDVDMVIKDAQARVERMRQNGRSEEDIANTYAGEVTALAEQNEEAMSKALLALAEKRTNEKFVKHGPYNRRRLAVQVASGSYNVVEEGAA